MPNFQTVHIPYPEPCNCMSKSDIEFYVSTGKWPERKGVTKKQMGEVLKEIYEGKLEDD